MTDSQALPGSVQFNDNSFSMCPKIYVSLTIDASERENSVRGREELFFMSKDCVSKLYKICDEEHVKVLNLCILQEKQYRERM